MLGGIVTEVASGTGDAQGVAASSNLRLLGFSVRENAASTATLILRQGTDTNGTAIVFISLAAAGVDTRWFGPDGIGAEAGVFVDRVSGTSHLSLWTSRG